MTIDATDLSIYLGVAGIDEQRAQFLVDKATDLCKAALDITAGDLPLAAETVVLSSAGRAFANPTSSTAQMAGPYQMSGATGGVYLTKAERASLKRLAGRTGAFSIDMIAGYPTSRFPESTA